MSALAWLIPVALFLGLMGLAAFLWALRSGQFEDLEGASWRAIQDSENPDVSLSAAPDGKDGDGESKG